MGFKPIIADQYIYRNIKTGVLIYIYIDDFIIIGPRKAMDSTKYKLGKRFKIEDIGLLYYFLGIRVTYNQAKGTLYLIQDAFINRLLEKY
jgi:hypothetical protein